MFQTQKNIIIRYYTIKINNSRDCRYKVYKYNYIYILIIFELKYKQAYKHKRNFVHK